MFEWDIFLSYGWSGNAADEGDRAWAAELRERLRVALRTSLGRDPKIFFDTNATRAGALTLTLENALDQSRLILFVVSPGSCQSAWCQWEILRFLDRGHSAATRNEVLLPEDRLFGALMEPVPQERIPAPLQPLVFRPFNLTRPVQGHDSTRPVAWDELDQVESARNEFDRLVADLKTKLLALKEHEGRAVPPTGVTVFLGSAPTPTHEREYLTLLRRDLLLRGHAVIRASVAPGETENDYRIRLGAVLNEAALSAHILGDPLTPVDWQRPVGAWRLRRASDHHKTLSLFTWVDPDRKADPLELAEILNQGDHHFDRRQPFSDLRTALLEKISRDMDLHLTTKSEIATRVGSDPPIDSWLLAGTSVDAQRKARLALPAVSMVLLTVALLLLILSSKSPLTNLQQRARAEVELKIGRDLQERWDKFEVKYSAAHEYSELDKGFGDASHEIDRLLKLDPHNGYARYFRGDFARFQARARQLPSKPKGCVPFPPSSVDDFFDYIQTEGQIAHADTGVRRENDCFKRPDGFCVERTAYVNHLLAYHHYTLAAESSTLREKIAFLNLAINYANDALSSYPTQAIGFEQCKLTSTLRGEAQTLLEQLKEIHLGE